MFNDWRKHPNEEISKSLLWEYDTTSPDWDWNYMATTVVQRIIERGNKNDYYAMFHKYGGIRKVREIVKEVPDLTPKDINWVCILFNLKKEQLKCYTRKSLRRKLLHC